ncbi:MAG: creatininase family protein [Ignavibacteriae bacterium]|nr:creatininase family protein [Ignavibacteriota bacterium]
MSIRPYVLSELNWKTVKESEYKVAILPWGATEAHNYHLPYSTDSYQSEYIAIESAKIASEKGASVIVLPNIPFGVNTSQLGIKLTINMNPSTQIFLLKDIVDSLVKHNIEKLVILNGHGGNDFKPAIRELQNVFPNVFIAQINWFQILNHSNYFEVSGEHADEMETSNMLAIKPELVLPLDEAGDGKLNKFTINGFNEGWVWAPRLWHKATNDTGIGNPKLATAEKGKKYLNDVTNIIAKFLIDLSEVSINNLYENH